jgi:hypothetical protein
VSSWEKAEVLREIVIDTLRSNGVAVTESKTENSYILVKDGNLEEQSLPVRSGRRHLQYLQRHFGVPIHLFFNAAATAGPALVPDKAKSKTA